MPRLPSNEYSFRKSVSKIDKRSPVKRICVFRCDESGLYAFTADRKGRMLPSQIYPQITWRFEQKLTLRLDEKSLRDQMLRVALDGIVKRGFHLVHAAVYGELLGFTTQDIGTDPCLGNLSPAINNKPRHEPRKGGLP